MTSESKFFLGILVATVAIVAVAFIFLSKPAPTVSREQLIPVDAQTKGNPSASVNLVEFSDFQCPACKGAKPVVDEITKTYGVKLLFVYRHFPLPQHQFAEVSARAAEAAGLQGKFWEAVEQLFQNQDTFSDDFFTTKFPQTLSLDIPRYELDRKSASVSAKIEKDKEDGVAFGINATPTFFLNGVKLSLATFAQLQEEVGKALQ